MTIVGIDLGTTNSLVSVFESTEARIIPNVLGERFTPSVVSIDESGDILVGRAARDRLITHPEKSAAHFKRHMGSQKNISWAAGNSGLRKSPLLCCGPSRLLGFVEYCAHAGSENDQARLCEITAGISS
jgi:hypothetical protein